MGMLDEVQGISQEPHNKLTIILGKPGSGKTTVAGTYPKPLLYVSIDSDGGGEVLKKYSDDEIKTLHLVADVPGTPGAKNIQMKMMELLNELQTTHHPFKSVVFDAYSSIEEGLIKYMETIKGKKLSIDERGIVGQRMLDIRDKLVELSNGDVEFVIISHIKERENTDGATGETTTMLIPKMSYNNGNVLLERASNVMYNSRKTIINEDGSRQVKFLTYVGPHPNMDTKIRTKGDTLSSGIYIADCTYDKINEIFEGRTPDEKLNVVEKQENPFGEDKEETKTEGDRW